MNVWAAFYEYMGQVEVEGNLVDVFRDPTRGTYWYQVFENGRWLWQSWSVYPPCEDDFARTRSNLHIPNEPVDQ